MSLLHYVTYKYVVIKDKRLGVAYYALAFIIIVYTLGQLIIQKSYLELDVSPKGSMRLLVNTPPIHREGEHIKINESYCCKSDTQNLEKTVKHQKCKNCFVFDALSLNWPVDSRSFTIATLVKKRWETRKANPEMPNMFKVVNEKEFFTWRPEDVVFKIEHSISAFDGSMSFSHRLMNGMLADNNGEKIHSLNHGSSIGKVNKISLRDILNAASVASLDTISDALNSKKRTYRENGLILRVNIDYRNVEASLFGTSAPTYKYTVRHVQYSDYRVKQEIPIINWSPDSVDTVEKRVVMKRYATRVEFIQTGRIGRFSLANLILQIVSALGLITLTATVIDLLALYIVPNKNIYRQYIFDHSPDLRRAIKDVGLNKDHKD